MSWFDARIEWSPENEQFREMLERLGDEVRDSRETLLALSDDVFTAIATEALEDGQGIPLAASTIERRNRAVKPKTKRRRRRKGKRRKGKLTKVVPSASGGAFNNPSHKGMVAALTTRTDFDMGANRTADMGRRSHQSTRRFGGGTPVALREIDRDESGGGTAVWGSKRWVTYLHPHIDGTKGGLPARLAALQPRHFESEAAERTKDVLAAELGAKLEAAGAPTEWIQSVLEDRY